VSDQYRNTMYLSAVPDLNARMTATPAPLTSAAGGLLGSSTASRQASESRWMWDNSSLLSEPEQHSHFRLVAERHCQGKGVLGCNTPGDMGSNASNCRSWFSHMLLPAHE
jgi:hypothetical protein